MKKILIASVFALTVALAASSVNAAFTRNLTVGSTGTDVAELQSWLISKGFAIPSISAGTVQPGYFGAQTKAAVMAYQTSKGLPSTGFFGPLTMASVNANGNSAVAAGCPSGFNCTPTTTTPSCPVGFVCTPVGGGTPITTKLTGTDGTIDEVNQLSQYNNEEVGDGENDVKVVGFEIETSNDGDVLLRSIRLAFDPSGNASGVSDHLDDYIDSVSIWMGDKKIGTANASDFDEGSNDIYTKTITLTGSPIVKADDVEKFYITVDAVSNFDSGDIDGTDDSWSIDIDNIRYEDGSGVVTTLEEADFGGDTFNVAIDFVDFSTAADTELKLSKDSSSPEDGIVVVDDTDDTDDVVLLVGKLRLEGTSDAVLDELPIKLTTNGDSVSAVTGSLTLKIDGEEFTETVDISAAQTGTVTFDNLDLDIEAGDTVTFTVMADVNDINNSAVTATDFDEGDYLVASIPEAFRNDIDIENEEGDQLTNSEKTGTITGDAQEFRTEGIGLSLVSTATDSTTGTSANDDVGLFTIKYKVTAIGDTVYVSSLATSAGLTYAVDKGGTATTSNSMSASLVNNDDTTLTSVGNYEIEEGESETFTLSVSVPLGTGGTSGQYRLALTGVKWDTTDDISMDNTYSSALDEFKTAYKVLN
jgi:peptidoglycan hydrolase-like protein with peptidoglycan-binding domain